MKIKVFHTGSIELLFFIRKHGGFIRSKRMPPVKLAAFSAPAHGFGYGRADEVGAESLVYGVVYIDAIEFPVFRQSMFLPCVAPGAFGYIGLQSGFGSKLSEFHLSVVVRD